MTPSVSRLVEIAVNRASTPATTPAAPASRKNGRLAQAVVVKPVPVAPAPVAKKRGAKKAVAQTPVVVPPKIVRIPRDPAVAAELRRKAEAEAMERAEEVARQKAAAEAAERAEQSRIAAEERARKAAEAEEVARQKAAEADRKALQNLVQTFGSKTSVAQAPKPKKSRCTGASLEEIRKLAAMPRRIEPVVKPTVSIVEPQKPVVKSDWEIWWNNPKRAKSEWEIAAAAKAAADQAFLNRIRALDPKVVARFHRDGCGVRFTWPSVERMLTLLVSRHGNFQDDIGQKMAPFVSRCEQG